MFFERFIPMKTLTKVVGLSPDQIRDAVDAGEFPAPVRLTPGRLAWRSSEIIDWVETRQVAA